MPDFFVHESSYIDDGVQIGSGTKIWHFCHVLSGASIGQNCSFGQNCSISPGVIIGDNVKVQNNVSIYEGTIVEDDVFLGPFRIRRKRMPLARLLKVHAKTHQHTGTDLDVRTATEEFELSVPVLGGDGPATTRDLLLEMRPRIQAMQRKVKWSGRGRWRKTSEKTEPGSRTREREPAAS